MGALPDTMPVRFVVLCNFQEFIILDKHAAQLKPVMTPYKGIYIHELTRETMEIEGLKRDLKKQENQQVIDALGLTMISEALYATNTAIATATHERETERGERIADRGEDSTASVRKTVASILLAAFVAAAALQAFAQGAGRLGMRSTLNIYSKAYTEGSDPFYMEGSDPFC